ncbi:hypothetical protein D9757_000396 [Collybiopsis confluens]|uniref:Uncharacterized protein n=1 Tax=Collybiopsis confluens TaxID=2823264 RepID=A0A8H5I1P0_9AGAR|nr:hypothetical protein D9757_000396 [Collybiopsis confluens]
MRGLSSSNEDVVFLILETIRASSSKQQFMKDLRSLSLTSRYLRCICLPMIFRNFRRNWDMTILNHKEVLPLALCRHVTMFELDVSATGDILADEPTDITDSLAVALSHMERLQIFRLMNSAERGLWPALLAALFTCPSLICLEIWDCPWRRPEEKFTRRELHLTQKHSQLQRFVYRVPFTDCFPRESESYGRRDREQGSVELSNLLVLAALISETVEVLELPAELALLLIAEFTFPRLRQLTIQGNEPLHPSDWTSIFRSAPMLRVCHLQTHTRFSVTPIGIEALGNTRSPSNRGFLAQGISNLESLTISNVLGKDMIIQSLPYANLRTLSLKAFPLPDILGARWSNIHTQVMTSSEVLGYLSSMQLTNLLTFELTYVVDSKEYSMLARVNSSFPNLNTLELHRFRPLATDNSDNDPLTLLPKFLTRMPKLQYLKLNLDFPQRPRCTDWRREGAENYKEFLEFLKNKVAAVFAADIPSLRKLGILFHGAFSSYWEIWEITAKRSIIFERPQPL